MQVKVELNDETYWRLVEESISERRSVPKQAEVMLRRALGLPFPYPVERIGALDATSGMVAAAGAEE